MHILILGGSGQTGRLVISEALSQNHTITVLARNPDSIPQNPNVTIITGSPLNTKDLSSAFSSQKVDAVIITLSSSRSSGSPFAASTSPSKFLENSVSNTLKIMKEYDVSKIVYMSAFGVGNSNSNLWFPMRMLINNSVMGKVGYRDHDAAEGVLRKSGLDWCVVRPVMLKVGVKKEVVELGEVGENAGWLPSVTRETVAGYLLGRAESEGCGRKTVVICNYIV